MAGEATRSSFGQVSARGEIIFQRMLDNVGPVARTFAYNRPAQIGIDATLVACAFAAAYLIRFDGQIPQQYRHQLLVGWPFAALLFLPVYFVTGGYNRVWRFFGRRDALAIARSATAAFALSMFWWHIDGRLFDTIQVPFGVLLLQPFLTYAMLVGARLTRLGLHELTVKRDLTRPTNSRRLLLVGAGEAGLLLLHQLQNSDIHVVGFLDDDPALRGRTIGGWRVLGTTNDIEGIVTSHRVDEVVLCMPRAPRGVLQAITARCETVAVKVQSVPTLGELMFGNVALGQLRPVKMEDLLGRRRVSPPIDIKELAHAYGGRRILVTGAGGSIGSELVRQLVTFQPAEIVLVDKDENNLYEILCEVREDFRPLVEMVVDIRNLDSMEKIFERHRPEVVFHAAAYKHVPLMEQHPAEAILNNVMGTRHVAELSVRYGAQAFVLISTDKAVNPSSMMGASKRVAEMIVQHLAAEQSDTRFCCVRFGNVLGSRASVVPIFQRQIRSGRNITVTHPDVRRYFMTIPEAVQLVIQAGSLGQHGEIFLLDMGDPVKIVDLARNLIELSGLVPDRDVSIEFTGLRPGEKLNEELLLTGERGVRNTRYSKIFVVEPIERDWSLLKGAVKELESAARAADVRRIHRTLGVLDIGYHDARPARKSLPAHLPRESAGGRVAPTVSRPPSRSAL